MSLSGDQLARVEGGRLELRPSPLRVRWELDDLLAADGHRLRAGFSCSVEALDEPAERAMLRETFLGDKPAVSISDVVAHFAPVLRAAAERMAGQHAVQDWISAAASKDSIVNALREAGDKVAFSCGLKLLPPFHLDLESPSFRQQRLEAVQRELAERRAAGQIEHFQRAAELLRQFRQIQQDSPHLTPGLVLRQISAADQGAMLEALLLASAKEASRRPLWTVGGNQLVRIDQRDALSPQVRPLPDDAGPARSIQGGRIGEHDVLLVGARSGVVAFDPAVQQDVRIYLDPQATSALGFNGAVIHGSMVWASHGDAGLVGWRIDNPSAPALAIRPNQLGQPKGPRNLQRLDDVRLVFSAGPGLFVINQDQQPTLLPDNSSAEIVAVLPTERELVIVREDGEVCRRDLQTLEPIGFERRASGVNAAAILPWLGGVRLLLACEQGPVLCVGLDDGLLTQYLSPHQGLRMFAASEDAIAAVSADRQRLIVWNSWDARQPVADVHLTATTRHRIADIAFLPGS